jgi:hypothetical protein
MRSFAKLESQFSIPTRKEVLLKAIIQVIPTYCMLVFLLPIALCKEINRLMQIFWWGHKENNSKIHWMCWEKIEV